MAKDYSEDQLIQKSTAEFMEQELGWKSIFAFDQEKLGKDGTLGRISYHETLLTRHLQAALKKLNPWLTEKQLQECLERMTEHMSSQTLMQINEQKYKYIRDGIPSNALSRMARQKRLRPRSSTLPHLRRMSSFASGKCGCMVLYIVVGLTSWDLSMASPCFSWN